VVADAAYAACLRLAHQHYENFPVASRLLPRAARPHVAAIYAFARIADDFADEGARSDQARLDLLEDWRARLHAAAADRVVQDGSDAAAIFTALGETMRARGLSVELLEDLLSAFRQDVLVSRYETWEDVFDYCRRSANPIGRLVLGINGYRDARLEAWSDAVCTALQLTNFWQDLEQDWQRGRLYVPIALLQSHGGDERDLDRRLITPAWRATLDEAARTTRERFQTGRPLADAVTGRLRWELRATWLGGVRILDRLETCGFDVFRARPTLGWRDAAPIALRMLTWRRQAPISEADERRGAEGSPRARTPGGVPGAPPIRK
jgi:phytoene synthase